MAKINLLDPSVFNMISAGEVVERPASVVKELVENSIDAGATQIDITIVDGGLKRIQVSDNGIGIEKDDIRSAFLPHATSKLERIRDLETLSTLGFRGEALASISSVSEVTLISKTAKDEMASYIYRVGGKVVDERVDARANGTSITVENLFFNTPARLKFMKAPAAEQRAIVSTVEKIVFANPSISISVSDGKRLIFEHQSGDMKEAICSIWGGEMFSKMIPVDFEKAGIKVVGYISNLDVSKATRSWQAYVVNGRAVENKDLTLAVDKAYEGKLVKGNYPYCVLEIILPFNEVDINVHPRKSEVRFRNKSSVFSAVYYAINKAFDDANPNSAVSFLPQRDNLSLGEIRAGQYSSAEDFGYRITNPKFQKEQVASEVTQPVIYQKTLKDVEREHQEFLAQAYKALQEKEPIIGDCSGDDQMAMQYGFVDQELANKMRLANPDGFFDGKIVGQIFDTYLIVEREGIVYIIDQHAAHERILFEEFLKTSGEKQQLLFPYEFEVESESQSEYLQGIQDELIKAGFTLEKTENSNKWKITTIPIKWQGTKETLWESIFEKQQSPKDFMRNFLATCACKAAIKEGTYIDEFTAKDIIQKTFALEDPHCPHGRPIWFILTQEELYQRVRRT